MSHGDRVSVLQDENILEADGGNDGMVGTCLPLLSCALKMVKMESFMLHAFYHNEKGKKRKVKNSGKFSYTQLLSRLCRRSPGETRGRRSRGKGEVTQVGHTPLLLAMVSPDFTDHSSPATSPELLPMRPCHLSREDAHPGLLP